MVPRSKGGLHSWENIVACCRSCNLHKADRLLSATSLHLTRQPRVPRRHDWVVAQMGASLDPRWRSYLVAVGT